MSLTPRNIEEQTFGKSLRGYDKGEVEIFLKRVADEFAQLLEENENLKKALEEKKAELESLKKIERDLQKTLLDAQETKQRLIEDAKRRTEEIIKEAEEHARQIKEEAEKFEAEQRAALAELAEAKKMLLAELNAVVSAQEQLLKRAGIKKETAENEENKISDFTEKPEGEINEPNDAEENQSEEE
jgi:cell division initiation protein